MEQKPWITRPGVIFGVATLLGFFSASQAYQAVRFFADRPTPFLFLLILNLGYWYAWALLTPIVLFLARRFPFERNRWLTSLAAHLPAVIVITLVHIAAVTAMRGGLVSWMYGEPARMSWSAQVLRSYFMNFDWEMMTYWAIVAFWHAGNYHRVAQERALRASQLETRLAEAQLQALQRQLHPHFLFNTLNTISALMHRDVEAADQMLARLSDLLRLALDGRVGQEVTLKDELEFLQKYLEIEETRFGERLRVTYDIEAEVLDARVPNLVLQPLVENSIRHAVAVRVEPGFIRIGARRADGQLELTVHDNGPGLPTSPAAPSGNGVGLANTRSRLEHLYGADHRFVLSSPPDGGLLVTVTIPFRADEPEDPGDAADQYQGVA